MAQVAPVIGCRRGYSVAITAALSGLTRGAAAHNPNIFRILAPRTYLHCSARIRIMSMIPQDLLDLLVCPECKTPVLPTADGRSLKCGQCRRLYPIQDDIPIMLLHAATIDGA